jgi:DNA-binding CsgD family transcriptional regulator
VRTDPKFEDARGPNIRELRRIQRRLSPAEVEVLIADYEGGGRVGELARIYGIHRTTVSAHMSRAGKTRGQLTAAQVGEGGCGSMSTGFVPDDQHTHAPACYPPVAYCRHIENHIRAGNTTLV